MKKGKKVKVTKVKKINKRYKITFNDKLAKFVTTNLYDIIFAGLSIIALIIGTLAIGFLKTFIIVAIIDLVMWFIPVCTFIGNKRKRKKRRKSFLQIALWCIILGLIACIGFAAYIVIDAPEFNPNNLYSKESTVIYDKDGQIVAKIGSQMREKVTYEELPQVLIDAIIATEDSQFFEHNGFNLLRFLKASFSQVFGGAGGGASTITMQVAKNAFTSFESSGWDGIKRKFTDIYLSIFKIEKTYTKEEIIEFYVNSYYMGGGAYGVEQASQNYFNKSVSELNLSEAALLAGIFKGGGAYDPFKNPKNADGRRGTVINLMQHHGYITEEEKNIAMELRVEDIIVTNQKNESYQAFIDTVVAEVKKKTGQDPYSVPMEIYTTMDRKKQEYINDVMSGEKYKWENEVVQAGIAVTDTNTGAIVAIGGGRNKKGALTFNYATDINRQIGSTAKPLYDYGPAIEYNSISTGMLIADEPHTYSDGTGIRNWDREYKGLMTARKALNLSRNIPALKIFQSIKNSNIKKFVTNLGLHPEIQNGKIYESHSIGGYNGESPLSVAAAYAAFANGGTYIEPYSFTKIVFRETKEEFINTYESRRAMSEATAYMITDMLVDTSLYTLGKNKINGIQVANKTGTTNLDQASKDKYNLPGSAINDLWCAGYSRDYAIALWYGYDRLSSEHYNVSKGQNTDLFTAVAKGVLSGTKTFKAPNSVKKVQIEKNNLELKLPSEYTPEEMITTEYFKAGTEPTEISTRFAQLNNVTNVNLIEENGGIYLTWDAVPLSNEFNEEYLTAEFSKIFKDETELEKFVKERLNENYTLLGIQQYEIYLKNADGSLTLVGTTEQNSYEYRPSTLTNGTITFLIKTAYSNLKTNASTGAEYSININHVTSLITSNINGQSDITIRIGDEYQEPAKPFIVWDDLVDVTAETEVVKITITDSTNNSVPNITTEKEETYTITYEIKYKNHSNILTKTIKVINQ